VYDGRRETAVLSSQIKTRFVFRLVLGRTQDAGDVAVVVRERQVGGFGKRGDSEEIEGPARVRVRLGDACARSRRKREVEWGGDWRGAVKVGAR
jgi:hypothetical protein